MSRLRIGDLVRYSDHYREQHCVTDTGPEFATVVDFNIYDKEGGGMELAPIILRHSTGQIGVCHPMSVTRVKVTAHEDDPQETT